MVSTEMDKDYRPLKAFVAISGFRLLSLLIILLVLKSVPVAQAVIDSTFHMGAKLVEARLTRSSRRLNIYQEG